MLPLPRVGGALSGALETSIVGTGARVKPRVRVRPRLGREHRVTIISQIWRFSGEERVGRKKMIEVGIPPLRGQPVEQQAFCGAECIDARALRLGEIDLLELAESLGSRSGGIRREGFVIGEGRILRGRLVESGNLSGSKLRISSDPLLPELEGEILLVAW